MANAAQTFEPEHFLNRELSWLAFNQRVLDEALDPTTPLLERVKFFCITSSNLDEFFEVRVAGIKQQIESDVVERSVDGLTATETFRAIRRRVDELVERQFRCWREDLVPALAWRGIRFLEFNELDPADRLWTESYFHRQVWPVLTPLGLDPAHPFPQLLNKTLNLIVQVASPRAGETQPRLAVVQVPRSLWDPAFVENSWIAQYLNYQPIALIPRMLGKINAHYPGTKLSFSEYYLGGGNNISGGVTQADALGVFGREGVFAATMWRQAQNNDDHYIDAAFLMYRNFDGSNGAFGDTSISAVNSDHVTTSVYASTDTAHPGRLVVVAINKSFDQKLQVEISEFMLPIQLNLRKSVLIRSGLNFESPILPKLKVSMTVPSRGAAVSRYCTLVTCSC